MKLKKIIAGVLSVALCFSVRKYLMSTLQIICKPFMWLTLQKNRFLTMFMKSAV